ncbi:hypothetical protein [Bosea sp. UC22_33]|uniref:hypothetical protein n=1 Tax=Bosea sp. UC22_33 TaxID=3350165 RepID=UPI00366F9C09
MDRRRTPVPMAGAAMTGATIAIDQRHTFARKRTPLLGERFQHMRSNFVSLNPTTQPFRPFSRSLASAANLWTIF